MPSPARLLFQNTHRPLRSTAEGTVGITICFKLLIQFTYCDKRWCFHPYLRQSAISLHLWELGSFSYSCVLTYCVIKIAASFGKYTTVSVPLFSGFFSIFLLFPSPWQRISLLPLCCWYTCVYDVLLPYVDYNWVCSSVRK